MRVELIIFAVTLILSLLILVLIILKILPLGFFFVVFLPLVSMSSSPKKSYKSEANLYSGRTLFCPNCGFVLRGYENFCPRCGYRLK